MTGRRAILQQALDEWRAEGAIDDATHARLRARVDAGPDAASDRDEAPDVAPARHSFAADAMQFVGGLLLGAGLVALVVFLEPAPEATPYVLAALGALLLVPAALAAWRGGPMGLVEAGLAGGLVPLLVATGSALDQDGADLAIPGLAALVCVGILVLRRGEGPTILVASAGFAWAAAAATLLREGFFGAGDEPALRVLWFLALCAYGALLLIWRERFWTAVSLAVLVAPLTLSFAFLLDPLERTSLAMELALGAWLGALLAVGILLRSRGLVAGAAAGLTLDAIAFAFDVGGPGTAVVVLLALGGLLVWQAGAVRRYFRRGAS